jgi:hypothetical protein
VKPLLTACWVVTRRATWNWNDPIAAPFAAVAVITFSSLLVVVAAANVCGFFIVVPKILIDVRRVWISVYASFCWFVESIRVWSSVLGRDSS